MPSNNLLSRVRRDADFVNLFMGRSYVEQIVEEFIAALRQYGEEILHEYRLTVKGERLPHQIENELRRFTRAEIRALRDGMVGGLLQRAKEGEAAMPPWWRPFARLQRRGAVEACRALAVGMSRLDLPWG